MNKTSFTICTIYRSYKKQNRSPRSLEPINGVRPQRDPIKPPKRGTSPERACQTPTCSNIPSLFQLWHCSFCIVIGIYGLLIHYLLFSMRQPCFFFTSVDSMIESKLCLALIKTSMDTRSTQGCAFCGFDIFTSAYFQLYLFASLHLHRIFTC